MEDDALEHTHGRAESSPACGPASTCTLGSKSCTCPPHSVPAPMLPTAPHPLGPAVPQKLLKRQFRVASPLPQGCENKQLFLFPQPQWDHQFSKAGAHPNPSHNPKPVVRLSTSHGNRALCHRSSKAASSKESPISCHPSRESCMSKEGKITAPAWLLGREAFNSQAEGVRDGWASQLTPALTQHRGSPAPNAGM